MPTRGGAGQAARLAGPHRDWFHWRFDLTCGFASLEPPPPEMQQVLGATAASQDAQDQFVSMMAGTLPVPAFFAPENVGRIMPANARGQ